MSATEVTPPADASTALPSADFCDAYATTVPKGPLSADDIARRAFSVMPGWIAPLLRVRNLVVKPFGLKPGPDTTLPAERQIGFFPLVSSQPNRVVLGVDDTHLDFRIVIDVTNLTHDKSEVTATTLVKRHNLLGRVYLAVVMPFHKRIVPAMLNRLAIADARI